MFTSFTLGVRAYRMETKKKQVKMEFVWKHTPYYRNPGRGVFLTRYRHEVYIYIMYLS